MPDGDVYATAVVSKVHSTKSGLQTWFVPEPVECREPHGGGIHLSGDVCAVCIRDDLSHPELTCCKVRRCAALCYPASGCTAVTG